MHPPDERMAGTKALTYFQGHVFPMGLIFFLGLF